MLGWDVEKGLEAVRVDSLRERGSVWGKNSENCTRRVNTS